MKAALLDRDGTIIVEPPHERLQWEHDIKFFPETIPALRLLQDNGFELIEITNQAGIGEGLISLDDFWRLEIGGVEKMLADNGIKIKKTFVCPHKADDACVCRKPKPYLLEQAIKEFKLVPANTYMIGDNLSDIQAGRAAGTQTILVKTGIHDVETDQATFTAANLLEAAQYIVDHSL